jgi:RND family efflux transporter MFP subunit
VCLFAATAILPIHAAEPIKEFDSQSESLDCVINPSVVADLGSGVPGILSEVRVDRSDFVLAGDVVAQLESGVEVAARDLARVRAGKDTEVQLRRVNAAFGRRQHARTEDLFRRKVISTNDMDERKTEARLASIQLRQAMDNQELAGLELDRAEQVLKRRTIKSPISGVVMERFKTIGEYVDENPVLRVAQLDPLHVEVFVPVEKLGQIRPGMRAEVWSEAVGGDGWQARVSRVDRVADVASGTYGVRLVLPNPGYKVPAGLRCRLAFNASTDEPLAAETDVLPDRIVAPALTNPDDVLPALVATAPAPSDSAIAAIDGTAVVEAGEAFAALSAPVDQPAAQTSAIDTLEHADGETGISALPRPAGSASPTDDVAAATAASVPSLPVCLTAGPYDQKKAAEKNARQLRTAGLDVVIETYQAQETAGYRVVSNWFDSRAKAKALVAKLKQAGVKDYFLPPHKKAGVRVALGLYADERFAAKRVRELSKKGFTARIVPWQRPKTRYALTITGRPGPQAAQRLANLPSLDGEAPTLTASCEKIAKR